MEAETVVCGERRSEPTQRHSHGGGVAQLLLLDLDRMYFQEIGIEIVRWRCALLPHYFPLSCILHTATFLHLDSEQWQPSERATTTNL
jgi:hypothetical protein